MTEMATNASDNGQCAGIDPAQMQVCLAVLAAADDLPPDHPDVLRLRRATAGLYKGVKLRRRRERRDALLAADGAVIAAPATGAPGRIDDETQGLPLVSPTVGALAGRLRRPQPCYI